MQLLRSPARRLELLSAASSVVRPQGENGTNLPWLSAVRRRFVLRSDLDLLYDTENAIEHRLDDVGVAFVKASLASVSAHEAVDRLSVRFGVPVGQIEHDLQVFWDTVLAAPAVAPGRKGGAPAEWLDKRLDFPLVIELELTKICNWHCDFCYNVWKVSGDYEPYLRGKHLPFQSAKLILDEMAAKGAIRVRFSGGEPTLHPEFDEIIDYAGSLGLRMELFTNGSRMTPERVQRMADAGLGTMLVSVHGGEETHNRLAVNKQAYRHSMGSLELAAKHGITVVAETLVCHENTVEVDEMVRTLNGIGVKQIAFMPYVPFGPTDTRRAIPPRDLEKLIARAKTVATPDTQFGVPCAPRHCLEPAPKQITEPVSAEFSNHCAAGVLWASISYDGQIRHCPHSSIFAGNIAEGIEKVWQERVAPTVLAALAPQNEECGGCSQFDSCRGGCHLDRVKTYPKQQLFHLIGGCA